MACLGLGEVRGSKTLSGNVRKGTDLRWHCGRGHCGEGAGEWGANGATWFKAGNRGWTVGVGIRAPWEWREGPHAARGARAGASVLLKKSRGVGCQPGGATQRDRGEQIAGLTAETRGSGPSWDGPEGMRPFNCGG